MKIIGITGTFGSGKRNAPPIEPAICRNEEH
jgi:hypothetical protein